MPFYLTQGNIPKKRHTVFNNPNGEKYYEELVSREGFSSIYSNLYHLHRPTKVKEVGQLQKKELIHSAKKHRHRHIYTDIYTYIYFVYKSIQYNKLYYFDNNFLIDDNI